MTTKIKTVLAVILILCTCLPLSRCEQKPIMGLSLKGQEQVQKDTKAPDLPKKDALKKYSYLIPIKEVHINDPRSFMFILVFIWPLPFWFVRSRLKFKFKTLLFRIIEICLIAFSFYMIVVWSIYFGETLYGGYIALSCISGISIIFIYEVVMDIIAWRKRLIGHG